MLIKKCVVLFSGRGSNLKNLLDKHPMLNGKLNYVAAFTNNPGAHGINICHNYNLDVDIGSHNNLNNDLSNFLMKHQPDLIILAGYMKIIPKNIVNAYRAKIINIHPSVLPKYPGLNTYDKVIKNKDKYHGVTIHFVDETLDGGQIILQGIFEITKRYSKSELEDITHKIEHKIYPIAIQWFAEGLITFDDSEFRFKNKIIKSPITYLMKNENL